MSKTCILIDPFISADVIFQLQIGLNLLGVENPEEFQPEDIKVELTTCCDGCGCVILDKQGIHVPSLSYGCPKHVPNAEETVRVDLCMKCFEGHVQPRCCRGEERNPLGNEIRTMEEELRRALADGKRVLYLESEFDMYDPDDTMYFLTEYQDGEQVFHGEIQFPRSVLRAGMN